MEGQTIQIRDVTIHYSYQDRIYELVIPRETGVKSIYLDPEEAARVKDLAFPDSELVRVSADGKDWNEQPRFDTDFGSLREVALAAWGPEGIRRALCIHDDSCMWFCIS